jgi:hypothetical protein
LECQQHGDARPTAGEWISARTCGIVGRPEGFVEAWHRGDDDDGELETML